MSGLIAPCPAKRKAESRSEAGRVKLARAADAKARKLVEELDRGVDTVLQRLHDERHESIVFVAQDLVVTLPIDGMDHSGHISIPQKDVVGQKTRHLA
jgi:hypothetical protein